MISDKFWDPDTQNEKADHWVGFWCSHDENLMGKYVYI